MKNTANMCKMKTIWNAFLQILLVKNLKVNKPFCVGNDNGTSLKLFIESDVIWKYNKKETEETV
jgi:hypothetical protein